MEKLINKTIYCDYNSTSPLSNSVIGFLESGDFLYANPSSTHQLGKQSKKAIRSVSDFLFDIYSLPNNEFEIVFHSGATEGLNSLILGAVYRALYSEEKKKVCLFYSPLDHSCIINIAPLLKKMNVDTFELPTDKDGTIDVGEATKVIKKYTADIKMTVFTWVNNETGNIQPLKLAEQLKETTGTKIIVDAVQSPGKISDWKKLSATVDAYVFSAHKFGALKGVGYSFIRSDFEHSPYIIGGGQQNGHRSGTENITGIQTIALALRDLDSTTSEKGFFGHKSKMIKELEDHILSFIGDKKYMISSNLKNRNSNTICFISPEVKANILMMAMDLAGLAVSSGSACSSGASLPSRVLLALGFSKEEAQCGIRLSFPPNLTMETVEELKKRLTQILGKYYH